MGTDCLLHYGLLSMLHELNGMVLPLLSRLSVLTDS